MKLLVAYAEMKLKSKGIKYTLKIENTYGDLAGVLYTIYIWDIDCSIRKSRTLHHVGAMLAFIDELCEEHVKNTGE